MFENIIAKIREVLKKLIGKETIKSKVNIDVAMSDTMQSHIQLCKAIHENKAPWINNKTVFSANIGQAIASEFARLVTIEFKSEISNNDFLNKEYQVVVDSIRNYTQFATAEGGVVFKPYVSNGHIEVDMVRPDAFFPTSFNSRGEILGAVFLETKVIGKITYTRLEIHELISNNYQDPTQNGYKITNLAYKKENYNQFGRDNELGDGIDLKEVNEWANLQPEITIRNVDRPLFSYFKMPMANTIDSSSPLGISIFTSVLGTNEEGGLLKEADKRYSQIKWEYEAKEVAIDVAADLLKIKTDQHGNKTQGVPEGKERLYNKLNIDPMDTKTSGWNIYSPEIRDSSLFNGLNEQLRLIEFQVGLAYGTLSKMDETAKTATEVKTSKQRSYQTVKDMQKSLRVALEGLCYAMSVLGILYKLQVKPVNLEKNISFSFDDSIIVDKESEMTKLFTYVSSGILKPEYLLMKDLGMTEEEVNKWIPNQDMGLDEGLDQDTQLPTENQSSGAIDDAEEATGKQLNGAQTQSLVGVLSQYSAGELTIGQAINIIAIAIGIDKTEARKIIEGAED